MNVRIESNFKFTVSSIRYSLDGELQISLTKEEESTDSRYQYAACLGNGAAEEQVHNSVALRS